MKADLTRVSLESDLSGATTGVIYLPVVRDSTLEKVSVRSDAASSSATVFEVRKNGTVITGLSALTINSGAKIGTVSGLSVALTDGDEITLNLLSGSVSAPVTLNLSTEDGLSSGTTDEHIEDVIGTAIEAGSGIAVVYDDATGKTTVSNTAGGGTTLPVGDLNATTNKIEKIQNRNIVLPTATLSILSDNFNDNSLNNTIWDKYLPTPTYSTVIETGTKLEIRSNNAGGKNAGLTSKVVFDLTDRFVKVKVVSRTSETGVGFWIFNGTNNGNWNVAGKIGFSLGAFVDYADASYGMLLFYNTTIFRKTTTDAGYTNKWLRLRHDSANGMLFWESSVDDTTWTVEQSKLISEIGTFDFTQCKAAIIGGGDYYGSNNNLVIFDDFNSNIEYTPTDLLSDKSMIIWDAANQRFVNISLVDLKSALNALP